MATTRSAKRARKKQSSPLKLPESLQAFCARRIIDALAFLFIGAGLFLIIALLSYNHTDPSWNTATTTQSGISNWMGLQGAWSADMALQALGAGSLFAALVSCIWGTRLFYRQRLNPIALRTAALLLSLMSLSVALAQIPAGDWLTHNYLGGAGGTLILNNITEGLSNIPLLSNAKFISILAGIIALTAGLYAMAIRREELARAAHFALKTTVIAYCTLHAITISFYEWLSHYNDPDYNHRQSAKQRKTKNRPLLSLLSSTLHSLNETIEQARAQSAANRAALQKTPDNKPSTSPAIQSPVVPARETAETNAPARMAQPNTQSSIPVITPSAANPQPSNAGKSENQHRFALNDSGNEWTFPPIDLIQEAQAQHTAPPDESALRKNAELLQNVLNDFKIEGDIVKIHPGPVVTLYEFEPAPGTKSSRIISISDDIARSMSAVSVRCAVVPGRNVIGIELPNQQRQIVYMRELLSSRSFDKTAAKLPLILGKDIGGQPILADLAKMPHLLVAGTTGSGKSVAVNTMILSLLYRLPPEKCRFIMIDPKMLELSVYDNIPHLLSPVVTEPGKAVVALKWTVQEMEERYRSMSKLGVRNIEGYNARLAEARKNGETIMRKTAVGFDPETGKEIFEDQPMDLTELPYIVVVVDEFADLMLVAGKDVENAIQRLAQMARAAGIHLIMATQRPSVDVITGVIKANFPTRISFAVTSKIDSRTILGEGGAEQLLGMGDMLYMAPGGRITRVHGPFVADQEVEKVVGFLKTQAEPAYMNEITESNGDFGDSEVMGALFSSSGNGDDKVDELYDEAVAIIAREGKASTSFIQRHLQIGYNRAARIIEEMERQGVVSPANATGKRQVLVKDHSDV